MGQLGYSGLDQYVDHPAAFVVVVAGFVGAWAGLSGSAVSKFVYELLKYLEVGYSHPAAG
jgi:hypothetical protein